MSKKRVSAPASSDPQSADAPAATAAAGPAAKMYEFDQGPAYVLSALEKFSGIAEQLQSRRRKVFCLVFVLTAAVVLALMAFEPWIQGWLIVAAVWFAVVSLSCRSIYTYFRGGVMSSFPSSAAWGLGAAGLALFTFNEANINASAGIADKCRDVLSSLQSPYSISDDPFHALLSSVIAIAAIAVIFGWSTLRRMRRIAVQPAEVHFCEAIVRGLVKECSPGARCRIALNPFPSEWSGFTQTIAGGKTGYFDMLLSLRLALGQERQLSVVVIHRRTSKGRRKHKGWKHKVKIKYAISANAEKLDAFAKKELRSHVQDNVLICCQEVKAVAEESKWGFRTEHSPSLQTVEFEGNDLVVIQGFAEIAPLAKDLKPKYLLAPELVLATIRGMSQAVLTAEASKPSAQYTS